MKTTVRLATLAALLLFAWYLVADRVTPYTYNARVKAIVIDIVPQVSGYVSALAVTNAQLVEAGELLARIDPRPFRLEADRARSELELATQEVGVSSAQVEVAQANLTAAETSLANVEAQSARTFELERKGIIATAAADNMRTQLANAESRVLGAKADLEAARRQLGEEGANNPRIRSALAALGEAELALEWTELAAPARGAVLDLTIAEGTFAQAGKPLMTFVSFEEVWVEAYMTENNLARVNSGDPVEINLDLYPGRIFEGVVASITFAASAGLDIGDLPRPPEVTGWMRDPQRFPVRIVMRGYEIGSEAADTRRNLNGQADVIIYTANNAFLNSLGAAWFRLMAWLSYAY